MSITSSRQLPMDVIRGLERAPNLARLQQVEDILQSQRADGSWDGDLDTSILHHVAATAMLRRGTVAGDAPVTARVEACLRRSWKNLTGKVPTGEKLLGALPHRRVLAQAGPAAEAFHEVILGDSVEVRLHPERVLAKAEAYAAGAPALSPWTVGRIAAVAAAVAGGVAATLFPGTVVALAAVAAIPAAQLVAGLTAGWTTSSYAESLIHDKVHHAEKAQREAWKQWGSVGEELKENYISHMGYHHGVTFKKDHVTQFVSEAEKQKVTDKLVKSGRQAVVDEDFGMTITWGGCARFLVAASPLQLPSLGAGLLLGGGIPYAAGFVLSSALYPLHSKVLHRYTHMTGQEMLDKAPLPVRLYLTSKMGRFITSHHFVHHDGDSRTDGPVRSGDHEVVNTNLTPPFGDWVRGTLRRPTVEQQEKMRRLRMLY
ncbi:MAG TPA: hypothetical protein VGO93_20535 [Candidatus Xenobia bacterium]|jgi:hypothetical protein